ncbi:MAG: hypothetical protein Q7S19_00290 [bacterium]|nr:hypothetical protein [bacterium]
MKRVIIINRGISKEIHAEIRELISFGQEFEYVSLRGDPSRFIRPAICTVTSASDANKTNVMRKIFEMRPNLRLIRSFTTRGPMVSDLPGEYIYNVPAERFVRHQNRYLSVSEEHENYYATHKTSLVKALEPLTADAYPRFMILEPEAVRSVRSYISTKYDDPESFVASFYILSLGEVDYWEQDKDALASDIPYIFLSNKGGLDSVAQQMLLFF